MSSLRPFASSAASALDGDLIGRKNGAVGKPRHSEEFPRSPGKPGETKAAASHRTPNLTQSSGIVGNPFPQTIGWAWYFAAPLARKAGR